MISRRTLFVSYPPPLGPCAKGGCEPEVPTKEGGRITRGVNHRKPVKFRTGFSFVPGYNLVARPSQGGWRRRCARTTCTTKTSANIMDGAFVPRATWIPVNSRWERCKDSSTRVTNSWQLLVQAIGRIWPRKKLMYFSCWQLHGIWCATISQQPSMHSICWSLLYSW